jgi:hypothetical protein
MGAAFIDIIPFSFGCWQYDVPDTVCLSLPSWICSISPVGPTVSFTRYFVTNFCLSGLIFLDGQAVHPMKKPLSD